MRGSIDVHRYLTERGIAHEFYRLGRPLRNIEEVAALLDLLPSQIVSAELFDAGNVPVLALVPAGVYASTTRVEHAAEDKYLQPVPPSRVTEHTGFLAHWLPPVGHEMPSRTFLDSGLSEVDVLYAAGGDPGVMVVIRSADLIRATSAVVAPLATSVREVERPGPVRAAGSNLLAG